MEDSLPLKRNWILAALMLTMMLAAMDTTIVSTAIPRIVTDLGGFSKFSWVFSIYLLTQTATIPLYGKLADLYGRKSILLVGIFIFLLGSAASAASWNIESLIGFRALQGLGAGSIMATVNTVAGDIYSVAERAKIQGWLSSIWGISAIIGPAIGGALAEYANWRWIFLINIPIGILSVILLITFLKENVTGKKPNIDYGGAFLIFATLCLFIIGLLEGGQSWPWLSVQSIGLLVVVTVLVWITVRVERKAKDPIMPGWLWTNKVFLGTNLSMIGMGIAMMGPETYLPTFTQASLGLGMILSGFILASMSIGWPTASALSGRLYLRIGFRDTALIGTSLVIASGAAFLLIPWPQPIYLLVLDQVFLGAGFGLLSTSTLVGVQEMVSWNRRGVVTGANQFSRNLGQSLGAAIFGAVFNGSLAHQLISAPKGIPGNIGNILQTINNPSLSSEAKLFLQKAINTANQHIYIGLVLFAILTFLAVRMAPRKFKPLDS